MKTVLIVGIARGGTSLTAGLVAQLGVNIITQKPQKYQLKFNPKGMFEHTDFMFAQAIGKKLKAALNKHQTPNFTPHIEQSRAKVKSFVDKHGTQLWGYKNLDNYSLP